MSPTVETVGYSLMAVCFLNIAYGFNRWQRKEQYIIFQRLSHECLQPLKRLAIV
ncbi:MULTISPECIES: hypothetical protein [unclassified Flavobacterium]|uniref:hypothetical protein n=1 Tax=unclassified Flavobacterium TaxID=196869 RepID=UPI0012DC8C55|nr:MULTISPECIES: hypothetical protein [unclassified Flavobacterium]